MKYYFFGLILLLPGLNSCSKGGGNATGAIYPTDANGNLVGATPNDNQWKQRDFSAKEWALFDALDTADLSGTTLPMINFAGYGYPNPYTNILAVSATVEQPFLGDVIVKYVVANNSLKVLDRGVLRVSAQYGIHFQVINNLGSGLYRLYFTYSAEGSKDFFHSWGNIRKE